MPFVIVALTLFAFLTIADADAETDAEQLAKKFSPILVLTEDTGGKWGDIEVLKPEPVEIMGAQSAENIWFSSRDLNDKENPRITQGLPGGYNPPIDLETVEANCPKVDFSANKFAFLTPDCYASYNRIHPNGVAFSGYVYPDHFNYPGETPGEWNNTYLGKGKYAGEKFPNTAYVRIWETTNSNYENSITVIKYFYFYPYNHWWNRHEGDWQGINVVVSSSDPKTAKILGVEYSFHKAHLSYYENYFHKVYHDTELEATLEMPGLASSFVFSPQNSLKLSQGTHPVVYVGAGSHGSYPFGGKVFLNGSGDGSDGGDPVYEYMTHTGKILSTQAGDSHNDLWESYKLVVLPENLPKPSNNDNMGLTGSMSWLGADILWGTPVVASPHSDPDADIGNALIIGLLKGPSGNTSPRGPYHAGWGGLKLFKQGFTGGSWWIFDFTYPFSYKDAPASYHHWMVIGADSLSGTVSLHGDVVVFPGATLTIKAGTTITFPSKKDRHQFKKGNASHSEIFVYGTLKSAGTSSHPVVFRGPDPQDNAHDWGGIQKMTGGTISLGDHTTLRNALPPPTIEGLANVSFAENDPEAIATYAVANPAPYTIAWSVSGTDVSSFQIDGVGVLSFADPPNHEQQALYSVDVVATDGSLADTLTVQVAVTDVNDPGTVTLSTDRPQVGAEITATLRDEDGIVGDVAWSQHYVRPDQVGGAVGEPFETTSPHLRLSPTLGGYDFYVRAVYTDGFGSQSAESVPTLLVGPPAAPASLTAVPGDGQVVLEWEAPLSDGGQPITGYEYRQSKDGGTTWKPDWTVIADSDEETTGHTVDGLLNDTQYTFEVRAINNIGKGAVLQATATPVSSNRPPVLTGFAEAWVSEGLIRVTTYHASDPDKDSLVWSLAGADAAAFELFGSGQARALRLKTPPDFEQQATYTLTVGVSDGSRSATLDVTVRVINIEEAGTVALTSTQPQVGTPLTATLSDPDGSITGAVWQWQHRTSSSADWADVPAGVEGASGVAELSSYTPQAGDVNLAEK